MNEPWWVNWFGFIVFFYSRRYHQRGRRCPWISRILHQKRHGPVRIGDHDYGNGHGSQTRSECCGFISRGPSEQYVRWGIAHHVWNHICDHPTEHADCYDGHYTLNGRRTTWNGMEAISGEWVNTEKLRIRISFSISYSGSDELERFSKTIP